MIHQQIILTPEDNKRLAALEAILFTMGGAVESRKLAVALECDEEHVHELAGQLKDRYDSEGRGMQILRLEDSYQMAKIGRAHV